MLEYPVVTKLVLKEVVELVASAYNVKKEVVHTVVAVVVFEGIVLQTVVHVVGAVVLVPDRLVFQ